MDNKLLKRIVAVAASAVMLTSSVLATELTVGEDAWNDTAKSLTFSYDPAGATKVTYLAYAAREATAEELADENFKADYTDTTNSTKYVFGEIVAVNQLDGSEVVAEGATLNVPVNDGLLTVGEGEAKVAATHIVLISGADNADTADVEVVTLVPAKVEYTITFDVDGVTSTATTASGIVAAPAAPTKDGYTFKGWGTTANDATTIVDLATYVFAADDTLYAIFEAAKVYKYGDANGDGKVNINDSTAIKVYVKNFNKNNDYPEIGKATSINADVKVGDANGDGKVNINDSTAIKVYVKNFNKNNDYPNIGKEISAK